MTIDAQITSLVKSFFVAIAAIVLHRNTSDMTTILIVTNEALSAVMLGTKICIILKSRALIERLLLPRSLASFDINPPRLSVNSSRL